ncbi:hypothetical protein PCIT_a4248 [Pseudoalteromonas citrea]|uniref:Response regulatory domain-containing protein n=2 Tax=Pseudoalteromonas citrea TaxID=43655 RepID=A0AAD4AIK3_9GAMM|nr:response regulator [Pseudoalteromonas citrea]KAF7771192.1 hypothetical protein PCIT_a4248 [Pseudoalteromonas citrea]
MHSILIIDDEEAVLRALGRLFNREYQVEQHNDPLTAVSSMEHKSFDLIISDIRMPNMDGFAVLRHFQSLHPDAGRILVSGYADIEDCQKAVRDGLAHMIVSKPWDNFELKSVVKLVLENSELKKQNRELLSKLKT